MRPDYRFDYTRATPNRFYPWTDEQRIALGFWPRTLHGWVFWCRYWSPPAIWWMKQRGR